MFDLLLTGGRIVTAEGIIEADVGVADGVIASINARGASATKSIDISGKLLFPGLVPRPRRWAPPLRTGLAF